MSAKTVVKNLLARRDDDDLPSGRVVADNFDAAVTGDIAKVLVLERGALEGHVTCNKMIFIDSYP